MSAFEKIDAAGATPATPSTALTVIPVSAAPSNDDAKNQNEKKPDTKNQDVKSRINDALKRRTTAKTAYPTAPKVAAAFPTQSPPQKKDTPTLFAHAPQMRNKDSGPEAALRATQRAAHHNNADAKPPQWAKITWQQNLSGAAIVSVVLLALWLFYGPAVNRDLRLANTYKIDRTLQVEHGSCKRYFFLLSTCSANLIDKSSGTPTKHTASYMVMFRNLGGTPLIPVRSTSERDAVSVRVATSDTLTNRAASLYGLSAFCLLALFIFTRRLATGRYSGGPALAADH